MTHEDNRPNILFLFTDQQRPDWFSMNPEIPVRTPHLQALSERGIWFTNNDRAPFVAATYNPAFILRMDGLGQSFAEGRQTLINDIAAAKQKLTQSPVVSQLTLF